MVRNTYRKRSRAVEQAYTVSRIFAKYEISLEFVDAGVRLLNSLAQAKRRTKKRADYIAKNIKFNFKGVDRLALIEVILGDDEFWQAWIQQSEIFAKTGLEADRPTIHRLDSDGHYEVGNIAVVAQGEHQQEHSKPVIVLDTDAGTFTTHRNQRAFQGAENVSKYRVGKMNNAFRDDEIAVQRRQQAIKELADRNKEFSKSLT